MGVNNEKEYYSYRKGLEFWLDEVTVDGHSVAKYDRRDINLEGIKDFKNVPVSMYMNGKFMMDNVIEKVVKDKCRGGYGIQFKFDQVEEL